MITITNSGGAFRGKLSLRAYSGLPRSTLSGEAVSPQRFEQTVNVPAGQQQQVTLFVPLNVGPLNPHGVVVDLLDSRGKVVVEDMPRVYTMNAGDIFVGILSDQQSGFNSLNTAFTALPNQSSSVVTSALTATTFPTSATVLESMDVIVLADFSLATLQPAQRIALQTWVNRGGVLIELGGANGQRTLATLPPALLPVVLGPTTTLPAKTPLLPNEAHADTLSLPVTISRSSVRSSETNTVSDGPANATVITTKTAEKLPLLVQMPVGQGTVCYLAFDLTAEPLASWSGASALWAHVLLRVLGDTLLLLPSAPSYINGPGNILTQGGILAMLQYTISSPLWTIALLLLAYLLILGPVRVYLIKRLKKPAWNWRIFLSSILVFSLLSYGLAFYQKGAALVNNTISLIQLAPGSSAAHMTTYMGMFVPTSGDVTIQLPNANHLGLAQPLSSLQWLNGSSLSIDDTASVSYDAHSTTINLHTTGSWTSHVLLAEQDQQLQGMITPQLVLQNGHIVGTITNTLPTALNDVAVLLPHSIVTIGHLAAHESKQVDLSVQAASGMTLASQLAQSNGLSANYFPYTQGGQAQTDVQRHMALLAALSGAGSDTIPCGEPCVAHAVVYKNMVVTPQLTLKLTNPALKKDPLLPTNTSALLIGWTEQALDGTDHTLINGAPVHGFHDDMIQMPLNLHITSPSSLLPDVLRGHVIDVQSGVQLVLSDTYAVDAQATLTFEFTLPPALAQQLHTASISTPYQGNGQLQAQLYNWHTGAWDTLTASTQSVRVQDIATYINEDGRMLVQLQAEQGTLIVGKPSIT